jgi:monoamine oxidase
MGQVVKVILRFRPSFGKILESSLRRHKGNGDEVGFLHRRDATFPTWWTAAPVQVPMLTGWAGGPAAQALRNLPREGILKRALKTLGSFFEVMPRRVERLLIAWHMHDWDADPYSRGAYSYQAVGGAHAPAALARPVEGTLFFAGEATEAEQSGTVPGAIASGRRAATRILKGLP